ncbi:unnamed protein product [Microthlaspi erraticum]|uniref:GCK domain-containing protein n=1 Tax=Microthlaspi erraticum TaxID=1685480 RepID=A0A6D2L923_9BRAS|nr:unnamed protein product [Microthlaspi erraticum]
MGSANSVNIPKSADEEPSTNQGESPSATPLAVDESKTLIEEPVSKEVEPSAGVEGESKTLIEDSKETEEEEEEESGECGFCTYIKGGECKEAWIALDKCSDEAAEEEEGSDASKCREVRMKFRTCLYENPDYYEPLIAGEAEMIAKLLSELHVEKEALLAGDAEVIAKAMNKLRDAEQPVSAAEAAAIAKAYRELEEKKKEEKAEGSNGKE